MINMLQETLEEIFACRGRRMKPMEELDECGADGRLIRKGQVEDELWSVERELELFEDDMNWYYV